MEFAKLCWNMSFKMIWDHDNSPHARHVSHPFGSWPDMWLLLTSNILEGRVDKLFGSFPSIWLLSNAKYLKLVKLASEGDICPYKLLFDSARDNKEEPPIAKCSGICPKKLLFDKSKICKECRSPKTGGIWPRNRFEDKSNVFKFGKIKPIFRQNGYMKYQFQRHGDWDETTSWKALWGSYFLD